MTKFRIIVGNEDIPYLLQVLDLFDYNIDTTTPSISDTKIVTLNTNRILDKDSIAMDAYTIGYFVNKFKTSQCTK